MLGRRTGGLADRRTVVARTIGLFSRMTSALRKVSGMPDYTAHVEHLRCCHPGQPVPTERQFYEEFIHIRYEGGPTRCC
jgi:uncharacterized short protein YbdD (DUF466 family)